VAKTQSAFPTTIDNTLQVDRTAGDTITSESYDVIEDALFELETKVGVDTSAVATTLDYKLMNAASIDPGHLHSSTSASGAGGTAIKRVIFPASCFETRAAAGWAAFVQTQGTNFDYAELDYDKDTDEVAYTPPIQIRDWAGGALSSTVIWKCNSTTTTQSATWVLSYAANSNDDVWDTAVTQGVSGTGSPTASAEDTIITALPTFTPTMTTNDVLILKLYRNADDATFDTLAVDAKLLTMTVEWV